MCDSGESQDVSVCLSYQSLSICQPHDSSVSQPKCDSMWNSVHPLVCLSSVLCCHPSATCVVKIPTSIAVGNFPKLQFLGKFLSICTSSDLSVDPSGSLSVTLSPSAQNMSKSLLIMGRKMQ